jgi:uncharacterized protein with NAD-binding domain and iron-sulfur cluster
MARLKIAVLGGGVGALTTAFHLTAAPGWRDHYEVTIYQLGWRLGGKGASGRNAARADRIEEHGLHLFLGFYDNAFALMRRVYDELGRAPDAPLARWDQAWQPRSQFVLEEDLGDHREPWPFSFPSNDGAPGQGGELPTPWQILQILLGWARQLFEATGAAPAPTSVTGDRLERIIARAADQAAAAAAGGAVVIGGLRHVVQAVVDAVSDAAEGFLAGSFLHAAEHHARRQSADPRQHRGHDHDVIAWLLRGFATWLKRHWAGDARGRTDIRRTVAIIDALLATAIGMIADGLLVPPVDWFKIDHLRVDDWLVRHGADRTSAEAPPMLLLRELVFARTAGVGAGTCLHYTLRMLTTYRGAFAYTMQAGMGDAMVAPLYQVLAARGVRFEFFHAVEELATGRDAAGKPVIDAIAIAVQAETRDGAPYQPLVELGGLPCWPSAPLYDQLAGGEALRASDENLENWWNRWPAVRRRVLRRGVDFDQVVLGIAIGAYPYLCKQLIAEMPAFAHMVDAVKLAETQAAQIWLSRDATELGWTLGARPIIGTCPEPFDTVADMSHLLPRERWPGSTAGVLYLTSQHADSPPDPPRSEWRYPLDRIAAVRANLESWLTTRAAELFPGIAPGGGETGAGIDWQLLVDGDGRIGRDRLDAQFWTGCWNPSDRYVLSVPGSVRARLPSAGTGYRNLVMAGDWTLTALSVGCVEAAVMSGMHAARALCGTPTHITGDDLPDGSDVAAPPAAPPVRGNYVEIDGNNTPRQPYVAQNVTMYSFAVEADLDRLQAICDQQLNLGGPVRYRPLGPFAFFVAAVMGPIASASPAAWTDEKDFGFWIPVIAGTGAGDEFHALRPAFFIPYLWVDEYLAAQAGREVFGYPKGVGRLTHPSAPEHAAEFSIDALVAPEAGPAGAPTARWQWRRLVTAARRGGGAWGELVGEVRSIGELGRAVMAAIARELGGDAVPAPSLALLRSILRSTLALEVPMVFLKQFRDVADGNMACYQAIIESPNRMTHDPVQAGILHGDWDLAIEQFATVRLVDRLGLRVRPGDGKVPVAFHFWVKFAFSAEPGQVIWRAV